VNEFFERLGMTVLWTDRAPFHVAAKEKGPPLMSGVGSITSWTLKKRMEILKSVSKVTESNAVIIVEEGKVEEGVSDLPVIRQLELDGIEKPRELKKIIDERSSQ
jgi:predicted transcriptional regulator